MGLLGAILGSSWALLGPSWGPLGPPWGHPGLSVGPLGAILGPSWRMGGPPWAALGPPWRPHSPPWGLLGPRCARFQSTWCLMGLSWGLRGAFLVRFRSISKLFWSHRGIILGPSWGHPLLFGVMFAPFRGFLTLRSILTSLAYLPPKTGILEASSPREASAGTRSVYNIALWRGGHFFRRHR